ncbi:MAG TPA: hypothetical protein VFG38_07960 [Pseudomonadales bacterium]|nr:hypothetical protein [Pseudomonadales bacterium]
MIALLCAGAMALVGVALVYAGWARANGVATFAGWATTLSSLPLWMQQAGADRGIAFAALTVMLGACALIGATAERRARRAPRRDIDIDVERRSAVAAADYGRTIAFGFSAGPLAAAAAAALALAFANVTALDEVDRLLTVALLTPLLWGVLAAAALYAERPWRGAAALAVTLALGLVAA